ncbi:EamA family transporter [Thermoleophilia bacterium SCSIO 60948]|nr:EamA family transporter [Thermoleophilia bacterium SCSIO 60948]
MVVAGVVSVQVGSAVAVGLFDELGTSGVVLARVLFAAILLVVLWRPALRGISRATWRELTAFGVCLASMNLCIYAAFDRIPLGIGVTLEFIGPLTVAIIGSRRILDLVWVGLAITGILLLAPGIGGSLDPVGVAFALAAGVFWGGYIVTSQRVGAILPGGDGLALAMVIASLIALPFGIADAGTALLEPHLLAGGIAVAILSSAIPYSLEIEALRRIPRGTFGVLMSLEPGVAALAGLVILGQDLALSEVMAIAAVVAASVGALSTAGSRAPPVIEA